MAITTEIKELMNKEGVLFEVAEKVNYNRTLNAEEKKLQKFRMHGRGRSENLEKIQNVQLQNLSIEQ